MVAIGSTLQPSAFCLSSLLFQSHQPNSTNTQWSPYPATYNPVTQGYFPQPPSIERYSPWIWDAVYDPEREWLEVLIQSRDACSFNHSRWNEFLQWIPEVSSQLAYGDEKNILVDWDSERLPGKPVNHTDEDLTNTRFQCKFYTDLSGKHMIHDSISIPIHVVHSQL